jgi:hypothetical protein
VWTTLIFVLWALAALPILLIILVLAAVAYGQYSLWRSIRFASAALCPKCGETIGRAAVLAAKERYREDIQERMKRHPGVKFRLIAKWKVECPACSFSFFFYPAVNKIAGEER